MKDAKYETLNKIIASNTEKVCLLRDDLFCLRAKNSSEIIQDFGEDYLEEFGINIPKDLFERYQKNLIEYKKIQEELYKIYEAK